MDDEIGIPLEGIAGEWFDYVEDRQQAQFPDEPIVARTHAVTDFRVALNEADEPELIVGIENGSINSRIDIVRYFADKSVIDAEEHERADYVEKEIVLSGLPPVVEAELRPLISGICA